VITKSRAIRKGVRIQKGTLLTSTQASSLRVFFATTRIGPYKVVSDGRAGNGITHWRAVYKGRKLVASLEGEGAHWIVGIAQDGRIRTSGIPDMFPSVQAAWSFIISKVGA